MHLLFRHVDTCTYTYTCTLFTKGRLLITNLTLMADLMLFAFFQSKKKKVLNLVSARRYKSQHTDLKKTGNWCGLVTFVLVLQSNCLLVFTISRTHYNKNIPF